MKCRPANAPDTKEPATNISVSKTIIDTAKKKGKRVIRIPKIRHIPQPIFLVCVTQYCIDWMISCVKEKHFFIAWLETRRAGEEG